MRMATMLSCYLHPCDECELPDREDNGARSSSDSLTQSFKMMESRFSFDGAGNNQTLNLDMENWSKR